MSRMRCNIRLLGCDIFYLVLLTICPYHRALGEINPSVFHSCLICVNIPPRKEEGSYTCSSRMGGKLCLLTAVGSLPLLRSRCKNPLPPSPHNLCMFSFMIALD